MYPRTGAAQSEEDRKEGAAEQELMKALHGDDAARTQPSTAQSTGAALTSLMITITVMTTLKKPTNVTTYRFITRLR